ncbi:MAG: SigB/SigF/SigG family RNA polymerase sigma factor [Clostridia bacterium]|nr:SigB/SigF/SigG family RNA polymerase sigma factor [Clostridia bacterium]
MNKNSALLERVHNGDKEAKEILIEENMGLVYSVANRYCGRGCEKEDLIQIGSIGLLKAVDKFDFSFGVQFSTYAVPMIMGEIKRFLRDDGALKVSRSLKEAALKGYRSREVLQKKLNREPTIIEISKDCDIKEEILTEAFEAVTPPHSIYESVRSDNREIALLDTIKGDDEEEKITDRVMIWNILNALKPRERQILLLRYFKNKTQAEVAKVVGVSQVQISRIEKRVIEEIRKKWEN